MYVHAKVLFYLKCFYIFWGDSLKVIIWLLVLHCFGIAYVQVFSCSDKTSWQLSGHTWSLKEVRTGSLGRPLEETEAEALEKCCSWLSLFMSCSVCFIKLLRTPCPGRGGAPSPVDWTCTSIIMWEMPRRLVSAGSLVNWGSSQICVGLCQVDKTNQHIRLIFRV